MENSTEKLLQECIQNSGSRTALWADFINQLELKSMVEIGVYRGDFAAVILKECPNITQYYMIDPWMNLGDWNKPANTDSDTFEHFYQETLSKTEFASERRVILRGTTTDMVAQIPNESLDFAYVDGDHTLRGATIDLISIYPKIKDGGWIVGDDFHPSMWQHPTSFEPTAVFPFAVYFAEAVSAQIFALPHNQFILHKVKDSKFEFVDLTGLYPDTGLRHHFVKNATARNIKTSFNMFKYLFSALSPFTRKKKK